MFSSHTKYEMSTMTCNEEVKATKNGKILVLSHPLRNLGVTQRVHLWLDGKHVVDFLLAISAILASSHGCGTIKRNLSKSAFSDRGGSL